MTSSTSVLLLLTAHFVGDFILQSNWMAINKSKDWTALTCHVTVYSLCFLFWGVPFALVTGALHWLTDFVTSRITSKLWFIDSMVPLTTIKGETRFSGVFNDVKRHWFFVCIGLDQLIHATALIGVYQWLF